MTQVKKMQRGITPDTRTTSKKSFKPDPKKFGGLSLVKLVGVERRIAENPVKGDAKTASFRGLLMPTLNFHFEGIVGVGEDAPYKGEKFSPWEVGSKGEKDFFSAMLIKIKHYLEVVKRGAPITKAEYALMNLDKLDEIDLTAEDAGQQVFDVYDEFYKNIEKIFNPEGVEPIYKDKEMFAKILFITKQTGKGSFELPTYVSEGILEPLYRDEKGAIKPPVSLRINIGKGESVVEAAPITASNSAAPMGGAAQGGADLDFMNQPA